MYALQYSTYGPASKVLKYEETQTPEIISPHDVIVKVVAASINPIDWKMRSGAFKSVVGIKGQFIGGKDFSASLNELINEKLFFSNNSNNNNSSGVIVAKGDKVDRLDINDHVFGCVMNGTFAEYVRVNTLKEGIEKKPSSITHEEAAGVGITALTSWGALIDKGILPINPTTDKNKVMIIGASGGCGTFSVQIAKNISKAHVTGVCSGKNVELVKSLGADRVIDYTKIPDYFTYLLEENEKESFDLIIDFVGFDEFYTKSIPLLKKSGTFISGSNELFFRNEQPSLLQYATTFGSIAFKSVFGARRYRHLMGVQRTDLHKLLKYLENREIVTVIAQKFKLEDGFKAHEAIETTRTVGKIILTI
nr:14751_t:CDS:2 [Entrophospora candida]